MTTSPTASPHIPMSSTRAPLRLHLDEGAESGPLDGAWWPQSRDLDTEAADLVDHFPYAVGRIDRLLFSRPDWDAVSGAPTLHRIQAARGPVKVGSFPKDDTHVMVLRLSTGRRLRLLVVPSDTEPTLASRMMQQAADDGNLQPPTTLLGLSGPDRTEAEQAARSDNAGSPT